MFSLMSYISKVYDVAVAQRTESRRVLSRIDVGEQLLDGALTAVLLELCER